MEDAAFNEFILTSMPHFIAVNYQRLLDAREPQERVNRMVYLYDLLLRIITIMIISDYLRQERTDVDDPHLADLLLYKFSTHTLTLDSWQHIFFYTLQVYKNKKRLFFVPELYDFYWDTATPAHHRPRGVEQTFENLSQATLEIQSEQGLPQNEAGWSHLGQEIWNQLYTLLNRLRFLGSYELIRVLDVDASSYRYELHTGMTIMHASQDVSARPRVRPGHFYLRKGSADLLGLHPLLLAYDEQSEHKEHLQHVQHLQPDIAIYDHLIQDQELQYLLTLSNKTVLLDDQRTVNAFLLLFQGIAQQHGRQLSWLHLVETFAEITRRRMASVRGEFRKDLYLQREKTWQEFESFLHSDKHCFVLSGKSGVGKSSFLLAAAEKLRQSRDNICVLMYDGANVNAGQTLTEFISQDVSDYLHRPVDDIWHEIASLPGMQGKTVMLCVDAINENSQPTNLLEQLDKLVQRPWPWLKVVFTCQPETLRFIKHGVKPATALYYQGIKSDIPENELEPFSYSVQMEEFTRHELMQAYIKYQKAFKLQTAYQNLSHDIREILREPLNLWLTANTYKGRNIPPTVKVSELVDRYIEALLQTKRLYQEDLELLEEQLVPLMFREGHYSNEITAKDIEAGGKKLRLAIYSEQSRHGRYDEQEQRDEPGERRERERRYINQSFRHLLNADILARQRQGREQRIVFRYERFYEYFIGQYITQVSTQQDNRANFFINLISETTSTPFLWGAVRNALAQEIKARGPELLLNLCYTDQQRVKDMLVQVLFYTGEDDKHLVQPLLERLVPSEKAGQLKKIQQWRGKIRETAAGPELKKIRNARKIAIEVAGKLKLDRILENATLYLDATIRAAAVRASYHLWSHDRVAGFALLERVAAEVTTDFVPSAPALLSVLDLSLIIFGDHYRDRQVLSKLQSIWHDMIGRLFFLEGSRRAPTLLRSFISERIISFTISRVFHIFQNLPAYGGMVNYEGFQAFFQLGATEKALYRNLVHYLDVAGIYSREQMKCDYQAALKIDNPLVSLTTQMGLSAHACAAPHDFLPFLKQLFADAQSTVAHYPYLTVIANAAMDVLDRDPMNNEMFDFFTYVIGILHECYTLHPETYHSALSAAPQAATLAPYIVTQYRREQHVRTRLLEEIIQAELAKKHLRFFELFLLESELPQVGIEKKEPRAALMAVEIFFKQSDGLIKQKIMEFLAYLYIYYPEEVEDFLEGQQASDEFRLQVRTAESTEKVGDLMGKRMWSFARDTILAGSPTLRPHLLQLFERAPDAKDTRSWMDFMLRHLIDLIYKGEEVRAPD